MKLRRPKFEVRVREKTGPRKWVLKSKFYFTKDAGGARSKYHGDGKVLEVRKVTKERIQGIGAFFTLGDRLLREFAQERALEALEKGGEKKKDCTVYVVGDMPIFNQDQTKIKEAKYGRRFNEQRSRKAAH